MVTAGNGFGTGDGIGECDNVCDGEGYGPGDSICDGDGIGDCEGNCKQFGEDNDICDGQCDDELNKNQYNKGNCYKNRNNKGCCNSK